MFSDQTVLVTGATGVIGTEVCRELAEVEGTNVRAGLRTPSKRGLLPQSVESVPFDFEDPESIDSALKGVDKLFLLTPGGPLGPAYTRAVTERLGGTDVSHVVKQSSFTPRRAPQAPTDLWALEAEEAVIDTGRHWTFLEPPWIDQNFTRGYFFPMVAHRMLTLPFGEGASAWVDGRDVASAAAITLTEDGHHGRRYSLTGPEAITVAEIAEILSDVTGEQIGFRHLSDEEWIEMSMSQGAPEIVARATLALIAKTRDGHAEDVTVDFQRICGREPKSFSDFAEDSRPILANLLHPQRP